LRGVDIVSGAQEKFKWLKSELNSFQGDKNIKKLLFVNSFDLKVIS